MVVFSKVVKLHLCFYRRSDTHLEEALTAFTGAHSVVLASSVVSAHRALRLHADRLPLGCTGESHPLLLLMYLLKLELLLLVMSLLLRRVSERKQRQFGKSTPSARSRQVVLRHGAQCGARVPPQESGPRGTRVRGACGWGVVRFIPYLLLLLLLDLDARQCPERSLLEEARGLRVVLGGSRGCLTGAPRLQKLIVGQLHAELDDLRREKVAAALCTETRRKGVALCVEARHDLEEEKVNVEVEETPVTLPSSQGIRERCTSQKMLQPTTVFRKLQHQGIRCLQQEGGAATSSSGAEEEHKRS